MSSSSPQEIVSLFAATLNAANETRRSLSEADRKRREAKSAKGELRQAADLLRKCRAAMSEPTGPAKPREQLLAMVKHWLRAMLDLTFVDEEHMAEHDFQSAEQTRVSLQRLEEGVAWIGRSKNRQHDERTFGHTPDRQCLPEILIVTFHIHGASHIEKPHKTDRRVHDEAA